MAQWVKYPELSPWWHDFDPWPKTSICHRCSQKIKNESKIKVFFKERKKLRILIGTRGQGCVLQGNLTNETSILIYCHYLGFYERRIFLKVDSTNR